MRRQTATTAEELRELPVHDAGFEPEDVVHDPAQRTVVVPFAQELGAWDPAADYEIVRRTRWTTRYRVALMTCRLTIRNVTAVRPDDAWDVGGHLLDVDFDPVRSEVLVIGTGVLAVQVTEIDVEATMSGDVALYLQRDEGPLGMQRDKRWPD